MHAQLPFPQELWEQTPPAVWDYIRTLAARVAALEAAVQRLEAIVQRLTERLQQTSRTSPRPPSSAPPQALGQRPHREPSGRGPGGQPGHEGPTRALAPVAGHRGDDRPGWTVPRELGNWPRKSLLTPKPIGPQCYSRVEDL
jgi:hypothetical protein